MNDGQFCSCNRLVNQLLDGVDTMACPLHGYDLSNRVLKLKLRLPRQPQELYRGSMVGEAVVVELLGEPNSGLAVIADRGHRFIVPAWLLGLALAGGGD